MSLESTLNTPKIFTIGSKEYQVKQLSILELSSVRQSLINKINKEWMERISTLAVLMTDKDRGKFLIEAIRSKPNYEDEIKDALMSDDGIKLVLAKSLKVDVIEAEKILMVNDQNIITDIFGYALGSDLNKPVENIVDPSKNA